MTKSVVLYFSGYGHTQKLAEAVHQGASSVPDHTSTLIAIDKDGNIREEDWETLSLANAIIFGSPTYMGGPAWQFKKFADDSSKAWFKEAWKNKIAAGFTNSASINGDKFSTLTYFFTLAMQHGMIWVGLGLMPSNKKASKRNDPNWLGGFSGALGQAPSDASPKEGAFHGDMETGSLLGQRVAIMTKRIIGD